MRVVVDARQIYRPERRGIGKTMLQLYRTLSRIRPSWQFRLVHQVPFQVPELAECPNVRPVQIDCYGSHRFNFWENAILPGVAWLQRGDVLHSPANTGPMFTIVPLVLHLHDLIPLDLASNEAEAKSWVKQITRACQQAQHILTGSEYSRLRIIETLKLSPEKISMQAWAPDPKMKPLSDAASLDPLRLRYGLKPGEQYIFAFGANDPRKNTRRILDAFNQLPETVRTQAKLLIVGLQEPALTSYRQLVRERTHPEQVLLHGFAPEDDLPTLLSGALGLVYASSYEGFGLPVLDAFACGTPVLAGNRTSVPEVAGDAAALFDPDNEQALTSLLTKLITEPTWRQDYIQRGTRRAKEYSWEATAEAVAKAFEQSQGKRGRR